MRKARICLLGIYRREFTKGFTDIDKENIKCFIKELENIQSKYKDIVEFVFTDENHNYFVASCSDEVRKLCLKVKQLNIDGLVMINLDFGDQRSALEISLTIPKPILLVASKEKSNFYMNPICDTVCGTLMITSVFKKYSINYLFAGFLGEAFTYNKLENFIKCIFCLCNISDSFICSIGHCPNNFNLLSINDETIKRLLNINIERFSVYSFIKRFRNVETQNREIDELQKTYSWLKINDNYFENIASLYSAIINYNNLHGDSVTSFAIDCWDEVVDEIKGNVCALNAILMDKGLHTACENDILSAISMKILYLCSELKKVTVLDVSNVDVEANLILLWHCGNGCISLLNKDTITISYRDSKDPLSYGLVQGEIDECSITLLSITLVNSNMKFLVCEGEVEHKKCNIEGTFGIVRVKSAKDMYRKLIEEGATQHISLVEGKCMGVIDLVAKFLGIEVLHIGEN